MSDPNTHHWLMPNGRHKGKRITRVPVSYLKWMINARHQYEEYAQAELNRRGTVTPELEVSGHAIDAASTIPPSATNATSNGGTGVWPVSCSDCVWRSRAC